MKKKRKTKAFTLVELVMVMVIIGLLAAIIVPNFTTQRVEANIAATKANLENLRTALALYYAQENIWPENSGTGDIALELVSASVTGNQYLRAIPEEPFNTDATFEQSATSGATKGGSDGGWFYNTADHVIYPDLPDNDANFGDQDWDAI